MKTKILIIVEIDGKDLVCDIRSAKGSVDHVITNGAERLGSNPYTLYSDGVNKLLEKSNTYACHFDCSLVIAKVVSGSLLD